MRSAEWADIGRKTFVQCSEKAILAGLPDQTGRRSRRRPVLR
jgi:hypothetical protein